MMVTDGITFVMSNEEIAKCVMQGDGPKEAAEKIVDQVNVKMRSEASNKTAVF